MPKQIYKIDRFEGGLNSNADPRDIADNELSSAFDLMVDELGTIRTIGGDAAHPSETGVGSTAHTNEITPGYGLFAWKADRTAANVLSTDYSGTHTAADSSTVMTDSAASFPVDALTGGSDNSCDTAVDDAYSISNIPTTGASYLAFSDSDDTGTVMIYDMESDSWGSPITGLTDAAAGRMRKDVFYAADGELRVCDAEFKNSNSSKWYGYIDRQYFQSISDTVTIDKWYLASQEIAAPDNSSEFDQAITSSALNNQDLYTGGDSDKNQDYELTAHALYNGGSGDDNHTANMKGFLEVTVQITTENYSTIPDPESFDISFVLTTGSANLSTNTFLGTSGTNYKVSTKSETASFTPAGTRDIVYTFDMGNHFYTSSDGQSFADSDTTYGIKTTLTSISRDADYVTGVDIRKIRVQEANPSDNSISELTTGNLHLQVSYAAPDTSDAKALGWDKIWEYGVSFIYDGAQESLVRRMFDSSASDTTEHNNSSQPTYCPNAKMYLKAGTSESFNRRITGAVWYIREASGSGSSNQWTAQVEYDFVKGVSRVLSNGSETNCAYDAIAGQYDFEVDNDNLLSPNLVDTYTSRTGILRDETAVKARYKTAVMVGRRMYIGNVKTKDEDGVQEVKGDAMLKSPVNRFDTFPSKSTVEAAINDGESITALEEFADRILQFKEQTLYIINVSQGIEFLEETYKYKGVSQPSAVCKTDYGIAWVNHVGCYLYDGKQVINLLEKGGRQIIKDVGDDSWGSFFASSENPMIGYLPQKRQLVVVDDNTTTGQGAIYLYDMVTQSWINGSAGTITSAALTNFANDSNGDLIWSHTTDTGTMRKWSDTSATSSSFVFTTKDIDFGEPGRNKKLYKALITYKGTSATNIAVDYDTDGGTTFPYDFANGTNFTSTKLDGASGWAIAELKPDVSSEANNIKSLRLRFQASGSGAEVTKVECVADSSDSLNGKYFDIYGAGGKTEVWIDTDNSGTSAPSGSGSYAQTIEVTEIETNDTADAVAIAVAAAVDDHANFSCEVQGNIVYITDAADATRTDASDGDTGFTITIERQGGTASVPADFRINDISCVYRGKPVR